jgi:AraC family transcriptional regulator, positive regulator of tynA and feaB
MHPALCYDAGGYEQTREQLQAICGAYRLVADDWKQFRGRVLAHRIGGLDLADIGFSSCRVVRDHHDEDYLGDHYYLVLQAKGSACMRQLGSSASLRPGDCTLIDSRYPSVFEYQSEQSSSSGFRQYSFHLPAELFDGLASNGRLPIARVIRGNRGVGRVLSNTLTSVLRNVSALRDAQLTDAIFQLLAATIVTEDERREAHEQRAAVSESDIRSYIVANVHRHTLTPQTLAGHFGISARQLYRLMAPTGYAPAALIWRIRLEHARELLRQNDLRASMIEIALSCGFKDPAHFSRAYHKAFGHSPTAARRRP